jgi:hypothetical protein
VHDVHLAPWHICALANGQWPILPAHSDDQRPGQYLHTFVLTSVDVPGNPATRIETYLDLEKFSACVLAALQERQVLARESVVEILMRGHGAQSCLGSPARRVPFCMTVTLESVRFRSSICVSLLVDSRHEDDDPKNHQRDGKERENNGHSAECLEFFVDPEQCVALGDLLVVLIPRKLDCHPRIMLDADGFALND